MRACNWLAVMVSPILMAQQPLTLRDAVQQALRTQPGLQAAGEQVKAAAARIDQARAGYLPKVDYSEAYQRSDNPVFVFGSLLTQHQFTEANFQIQTLNRPDFLNNFQSVASVDQTIWNAGATRRQVTIARLGRSISAEDEKRTRLDSIARVIEAYFGAKMAQANLASAREGLRSAEADAQRAETVRKAGMSTDADVLSIRVHLATMRELEIRRNAELNVARAALNEALGISLDVQHDLLTELQPVPLPSTGIAEFESQAINGRPELRQAHLASDLAREQSALARAALFPQVAVRAAFEADRQEFIRKGGANWFIGATLRWNLFNGNSDRSRMNEASHALAASEAQARRTEAGVRLEVLRAWSMLRAADERVRVASAAVDMAQESLRITKNRYDAGMSTVTELLRNETALTDVRTRRIAAVFEQRLAAAALELASGTLSPDSEVLQ
jgi:outer membrane protein TolC